jgi:hypothetical protein
VGIALGHVLHPLGDLRRQARETLEHAKEGWPRETGGLRNALGLTVVPRGGGPVTLVGRWDEVRGPCTGLDERLARWRQAHQVGKGRQTGEPSEGLSQGAAYDLGRLLRRADVVSLLPEAQRLFSRRLGPRTLEALMALLPDAATPLIDAKKRCRQLQHEWYVARWLDSHAGPAQDAPPTTETTPETQA